MFKRNKKRKPVVIPTSRQDWPAHDESWADFMVRSDYEADGGTGVAIVFWGAVIACAVVYAFIQAVDSV